MRLLQPAGSVKDRLPIGSRLVGLLGAAALCTLGLPSPGLAHDEQSGSAELAGHVVEPAQAPSLGAIFREVPHDLWRFVSLDTALVLTIGVGAAAVAHIWDDDFAAELLVNPQLNNTLAPGNTYGAFAVIVGGSVAVYGVGRVSRLPHLAVVGADLLRGQILTQVWVQALKYTVQRERPDESDSVSFPSGHAAAGFAVATVLSRHYGWKAAIPGYLGATYIAAARVHDNRHYLSDVTFGAAMGIAGSRTVLLKKGRYGLQVAPALVPGAIVLRATMVPVRQ